MIVDIDRHVLLGVPKHPPCPGFDEMCLSACRTLERLVVALGLSGFFRSWKARLNLKSGVGTPDDQESRHQRHAAFFAGVLGNFSA